MRANGTRLWAFGAPILVLWAVMTYLLVDRELGIGVMRLERGAAIALLEPTESWLGLYVGEGERVGTIHLQRFPEASDGVAGLRTKASVDLSLRLFGRNANLDLDGDLWQASQSTPGRPSGRIGLSIGAEDSQLEFQGVVVDDHLEGELRSAGDVQSVSAPLAGDLTLTSGLGTMVALPRLQIGQRVAIASFDPLQLRPTEAILRAVANETIELEGQRVQTQRVEVTSLGFKTEAWLDADGEVLRAETPLGLVIERITPDEAAREMSASATDFLAATRIVPTGEAVSRGVSRMRFRIHGDLPSDGLPSGPIQRLVGPSEYVVEPQLREPATLQADERSALLAAEALVQSDHPEIVAKAREITAGVDGERAQIEALSDWVFTTLDKTPVITVPSALEVLRTKRGDCNEHTILFTALARAAGLPTRIGVGVVWSELLDGFYYHAWPEVFTESSGWIWTDPTLGQLTADATHVKLLSGNVQEWTRLLPYLGQLQIEVLDVR